MAFQLTIEHAGKVSGFNIPPELAELVDRVDTAGPSCDLPLGEPVQFDVEEVIQEVRRIRSVVKEHAGVSYNYKFGMFFMGEPPYEEGGGSVGGFKIGGIPASISARFEECDLQFYEVLHDGTTKVIETRDVRDQKEIQTDDWGVIKIIKRKARGSADQWLAKLIKKLEEMEGEVVICFA